MSVEYKKNWHKGLGISCGIHFFLMAAIGLAGLLSAAPPLQPEHQIAVDLQMPDEKREDAVGETAAGRVSPEAPTMKEAKQGVASASALGPPLRQNGRESPAESHGETGGSSLPQGAEAAGAPASVGSGTNMVQSKESGSADIAAAADAFAARVERNKEYPYMALKRGQSGTVVVFVSLNAKGELGGVEIIRSSGIQSLDQSAVKAVRKSCPFAHHAGRAIEMEIPVRYELMG